VRQRGFGIERRPTGGRAILHADEITYCVVGASPSPLFGDSLHSTYMKINEALVAFLRDLGLNPEISGGEAAHELRGALCFKSAGQHEIRVGGRKLIGSAQRRRGGVFLQHGSILTGPGHADLVDCVVPERRTISREQLLALTTDLGQLLGRPLTAADHDDLAHKLVAAFARTFDLEPEVMGFGEAQGRA
jgi:lipoate-protein ligase A